MIPKKIHYCWFGRGKLPKQAIKCINSWKKYLPDYEIIEWNEDNFDVNMIPYTRNAYREGKYAFVSDFARFWILYHSGGLYFDTDVEVIRNMDHIISAGPFMGCENKAEEGKGATTLGVAPGLGLGVNPGLGLYKEIIEKYESLDFNGENKFTTIVTHVTRVLCNHGLKNTSAVQEVCGIKIYPQDYFCPKSFQDGILYITENTVCIHHYAASWLPKTLKYRVKYWLSYNFPVIFKFCILTFRKVRKIKQ